MADAGTAGTVAAGNTGSQRAGGIAGLFGAKTKKAQGPNAAAYDDERNRAHASADTYNGLAQNYTQNAPTIANQYQGESRFGIASNLNDQRGLASSLMQNNGEASRAQFQGGLDRSIDAQMAAANSAPGGAVAQAGAVRNAAAQGAMMRAQGAATAAQLGAQERQAALGQAAGIYNNMGGQLQGQYGIEQNSAMHQADLQGQNQAQQNAMRLGYGQLGGQAQGQSLNALNSYTQGNMAAQGLSAGLQGASGQAYDKLIGAGANVVGGVVGGLSGPPKAAQGGGIGPSSNSIAELYGTDLARTMAPRKAPTATLADALRGIEELKEKMRTRADGGSMGRGPAPWLQDYMADRPQGIPNHDPDSDARAQWERSFGSDSQAQDDVRASDNRHEAEKIRARFAADREADRAAHPSFSDTLLRGVAGGLGGLGSRAAGGAMGDMDGMDGMDGMQQLSGAGMSSADVLAASAGRTGNAMAPVGGGGVVGGGNVPGGAGGSAQGGLGGLVKKLGGFF